MSSNDKHLYSSPASSRRATTRVSPFFRDLASPICSSSSASRHHLRPPSTAAGAPPTAPPPPPLFSLDDISPDRDLASPSSWTPPVGPSFSRSTSLASPAAAPASSFRARLEEASGSGELERRKAKGKGLAVEEEERVVESGALILHPTVDNESKHHIKRNESANGGMNEEEWVTVFGFYPSDTNTVLREFEKCGVILRHITGPRDANWIHILYQNRYDARRALERDGKQINSSVIIGVKLVDQMEKKILNEKINTNNNNTQRKQNGFMVSNNPPAVRGKSNTVTVSGPHRSGNVAVPAKSIMSKALDLVFGM
ncbi:hypothetical protein LUZ60_008400 [Juncus effusus]|nr:hypothetical protein LUZ60_008400 [Juncus effusus]